MKIYQIYYDKHSRSKISPLFTPYDNSKPDREGEFEYGVMRKLYHGHDWSKDSHLGVLSWKFFDKLEGVHNAYVDNKFKLNRKSMVDSMEKYCSDGYDVIFVNPWPDQGPNIWVQGEACHPGLLKRTFEIFGRCWIPWHVCSKSHTEDTICFCNYWIANKKFWDIYMRNTEIMHDVYKEEGIDKFFPYIMERMFSTLVLDHMHDLRVANLNLG